MCQLHQLSFKELGKKIELLCRDYLKLIFKFIHSKIHSLCHRSVGFDESMELYYYLHDHDTGHLCFLKTSLVLPSPVNPSLLPPVPGNHLFPMLIVFPFPECHRNEIIQLMAFCIWLLSRGITHLKFIHAIKPLSIVHSKDKTF